MFGGPCGIKQDREEETKERGRTNRRAETKMDREGKKNRRTRMKDRNSVEIHRSFLEPFLKSATWRWCRFPTEAGEGWETAVGGKVP